MKYRKRPVEIEAIKYDGTNYGEVTSFMSKLAVLRSNKKIIIPTLKGDITADVGDFIIKGVQGEFYPCKPDIFEQTYEAIE